MRLREEEGRRTREFGARLDWGLVLDVGSSRQLSLGLLVWEGIDREEGRFGGRRRK
jgi:hypothetical protein